MRLAGPVDVFGVTAGLLVGMPSGMWLISLILLGSTWWQSRWNTNCALVSLRSAPFILAIAGLACFLPAIALVSYLMVVAIANLRRHSAIMKHLWLHSPSWKLASLALLAPIANVLLIASLMLTGLMSVLVPAVGWPGGQVIPFTLGFCGLLVFTSWSLCMVSANMMARLVNAEHKSNAFEQTASACSTLAVLGSWFVLGVVAAAISYWALFTIFTPLWIQSVAILVPALIYLFYPPNIERTSDPVEV